LCRTCRVPFCSQFRGYVSASLQVLQAVVARLIAHFGEYKGEWL
jgi:hypothetical protein